VRKKVCVFCGSSAGNDPAYAAAARALGKALVERGLELVYGGGSIGLMGACADEVLSRKGRVTGVIPRTLFDREVGHRGLTEIHIVDTMHERKQLMADKADAFVVLPGGYGTLDETFEVLTWALLGIHEKPIVLVSTDGFWRPLVELVDHMVAAGFVKSDYRALVNVAATPDEALDLVQRWKPPVSVEQWAKKSQR
jgi:uncharacterized protein (TIGR00730 family)